MTTTVEREARSARLEIATSHSPFLSRPAELAELLVTALDTEPIGPLLPDELAD